jgi:hypothetical protein
MLLVCVLVCGWLVVLVESEKVGGGKVVKKWWVGGIF